MAATAWQHYNSFPELLGNGSVNLNVDAFSCLLYLSTSNAATLTNVNYIDLTNEHANANGYSPGGVIMSSVTWSRSAGVTTFDSADVVWNAAGGSITARYAVIKDDTALSEPLICFSLLDNTPADVTATDTNSLTIQMNAAGIFSISV